MQRVSAKLLLKRENFSQRMNESKGQISGCLGQNSLFARNNSIFGMKLLDQ